MCKKIAVFLAIAFLFYGQAYAGKPSSSGRSYSSGGSSRSSSAGRSYSSGGSKSYSSGGSKSYSSGGSTSSSGSKSIFGGSSSGSSSNKGKSYSSGGLSNWFSKSSSSDFNKSLSQAAKKESSKSNYDVAKESAKPKTSLGDNDVSKYSKGRTYASNSSPNYTYRPKYRSNDYENRATIFYGSSYSQPTYYQDNFSPFLMGWLLSDSISSRSRAEWIYNHQGQIDQARYDELLRKDARLQAELDSLKSQQTPINPNYVPKELQGNEDLMYSKDYLEKSNAPISFPKTIWWIIKYGCLLTIIISVIYLMFIKEFK